MAKRTFKPADVPPLRRSVSIGTTVPIFTAADVLNIRNIIGLEAKKDRNSDHVAAAWSQAFFHAADFLPFEVHTAPNQLRDFYAGVDEAAQALLKALGFTGTPGFVIGEIEGWNRRPADAVARLKEMLSNATGKDIPLHFGMALRVAPPNYKETDREPFNAALDAVPYAVALLALTARIGRQAYANVPAVKSGPKPSAFRSELFEILAGGFGYAFGSAPDTGSERGKADNASQAWVAWVLRTAAERIADCILQNILNATDRSARAEVHPLVCKVRKLAQLTPVRLADLLAKGQREVAKREPGTAVQS